MKEIYFFIVVIIIALLLLIFIYFIAFSTKTYEEQGKIYKVLLLRPNETKAATILCELSYSTNVLKKHIEEKYKMTKNKAIAEIIAKLNSNYVIIENDPILSGTKKTYTEGGTKIIICIRDKKYKFYNTNTLMFVFLHEIAHICADKKHSMSDSHSELFWATFKFLLLNATESSILKEADYDSYPITYCDLKITHNPIYDTTIKTIAPF